MIYLIMKKSNLFWEKFKSLGGVVNKIIMGAIAHKIPLQNILMYSFKPYSVNVCINLIFP